MIQTTCPRCRCEPPPNATFCPFCGSSLDTPAARPAAPSAPFPVPAVRMGESEARECDEAKKAAVAAVVILRCDVAEFDRVDVMRKARELLGSALHPYLGAAVDAAMSAKE